MTTRTSPRRRADATDRATTGGPGRGATETLGLALILAGGGLAVVLLIPVLLVVALAGDMAMSGIVDEPGLFVCREPACVDQAGAIVLAGLGITLTVVLVIVLAVWSRAWSMVVVAVIGTSALALVVWLALSARAAGAYDEVVVGLLVVAAAPGCLALGSVLRLKALRG
jgi:hypothetical protein